MRIISGVFKGRNIPVHPLFKHRPTTDRAREALFNILAHTFPMQGLNVLDLFAGTGSLSLELLSRGAAQCTAVDLHPSTQAGLRQIIRDWQLPNLKVIRKDVFRLIDKPCETPYDLILCDPPFDLPKISELPNLIFSNHWLKEEGLLVIEHGKDTNFAGHTNFIAIRQYSAVHFSMFQHGANNG